MEEESYISLGDLAGMALGSGLSSLPSCEEERPGSSLSTASRSSKIPVLTRSHSLRVKSSSAQQQDGAGGKAASKGRDVRQGSKTSQSSGGKGLVRSASFVSSRGMKSHHLYSPTNATTHHNNNNNINNNNHTHNRLSLTPESTRRASHGSSNNNTSKRFSLNINSTTNNDRKSHSYAGMSGAWNHYHQGLSHNHHHHHHNQYTPRRPNTLTLSGSSPGGGGGGGGGAASSPFNSLPFTPVSQSDSPPPSSSAASRSPDNNDIDDADSVKSFGSVSSAVSCDAAYTHHHHHHHNSRQGGTTTSSPSGSKGGVRSFKYVLHCRHNHDNDTEQYLTPTQRAARRIRELKTQLAEARRDVQQRDGEIARLTRELVELRLLKARTHHWQDEDEDGDEEERDKVDGKGEGETPRPASVGQVRTSGLKTPSKTPSEGSEPELRRIMENMNSVGLVESSVGQEHQSPSPGGGGGGGIASLGDTGADSIDCTRSSADSGHYDDRTSPSLSSKDPLETSRGSLRGHHTEEEELEEDKDMEDGLLEEVVVAGARTGEKDAVDPWAAVEEAQGRIREEYERREEILKRNHMEEYHELKEKHNDRVESLLSKLSDANLKYFELRPLYDQSQERGRELERDVMRLKEELTDAELRHQKMYLQMFLKGQQAARIQAEDNLDVGDEGLPSSLSSSGPIMELMRQLSRAEDELEKVKALYHREINCRNNNNNNTTRRNGDLDPEVTLQFLKSAIYYFFTDRDNAKGHLRAIESILGYSDSEKHNIGKVIK